MSERFSIVGTGGKRGLAGSIAVAGAKNEALKVMPAALLFDGGLSIERVPDIEDIRRMTEILSTLGARVEARADGSYFVVAESSLETTFPEELSTQIRASIVLAGPLLARHGKATFYYPGGCLIGRRPIDIFLDGFKEMGAVIEEEPYSSGTRFHVSAPRGRLSGGEIVMKAPSVTATETFLLAAQGAEGTTTIHNAALEPEAHALAAFLLCSGAKIEGIGTPTLRITGPARLSARGAPYRIMPDRIEAGTFAVIAALAGRDVTITDCEPDHIRVPLSFLRRAGVPLEIFRDRIRIVATEPLHFSPLDVKTQGYPGFPTDLQPLLALFLTQADGESSIFETIFESRMEYLPELRRMGADIEATPTSARIKGPTPLFGIETPARDLRSGMAFVAAGLIASGTTIVHNGYNINRGYAAIDERLRALGADITRLTD